MIWILLPLAILLAFALFYICDGNIDVASDPSSSHLNLLSDTLLYQQAESQLRPVRNFSEGEWEYWESRIKEGGISLYYAEKAGHRWSWEVNFDSLFSVSSNLPLRKAKESLYFEVKVMEIQGELSIGLTSNNYPSFVLPGYLKYSVAFHSSANKFYCSAKGTRFGAKIVKGDVIGCGFNRSEDSVWFTRNGRNLGMAYRGLPNYDWYPTIGGNLAKVIVNFGQMEYLVSLG